MARGLGVQFPGNPVKSRGREVAAPKFAGGKLMPASASSRRSVFFPGALAPRQLQKNTGSRPKNYAGIKVAVPKCGCLYLTTAETRVRGSNQRKSVKFRQIFDENFEIF